MGLFLLFLSHLCEPSGFHGKLLSLHNDCLFFETSPRASSRYPLHPLHVCPFANCLEWCRCSALCTGCQASRNSSTENSIGPFPLFWFEIVKHGVHNFFCLFTQDQHHCCSYNPSFIMTTMRRLSDGDVRAIFESLHGNHLPPPHLKFRIVPVGADGLKLSPPSFEFKGTFFSYAS